MLASRYQAVYTDDSGRLARQQLVAHYPISRVVQTEWLHVDAQNRIHPMIPLPAGSAEIRHIRVEKQ